MAALFAVSDMAATSICTFGEIRGLAERLRESALHLRPARAVVVSRLPAVRGARGQ
jgi:hypothetical protein